MLNRRLFELQPSGDPFSAAWDVHEFETSFTDATCTYRGDLSGLYRRAALAARLRVLYPGCLILVRANYR